MRKRKKTDLDSGSAVIIELTADGYEDISTLRVIKSDLGVDAVVGSSKSPDTQP
jgi:hypothetical protein